MCEELYLSPRGDAAHSGPLVSHRFWVKYPVTNDCSNVATPLVTCSYFQERQMFSFLDESLIELNECHSINLDESEQTFRISVFGGHFTKFQASLYTIKIYNSIRVGNSKYSLITLQRSERGYTTFFNHVKE